MNLLHSLSIFVVCAGHIQARSMSYSQIGDIRIEHVDGKWLCDNIECPADTYRCFVSKSNEKDPAILVRTVVCYTKDNKSLAERLTSTSIDPNSHVNIVVNSYRNGMITTSNSYSNGNGVDPDFDEEKFEKEMAKLDSNLKDMNNKIQGNLQNQMNHLQQTLSNMEYNLAHMFD